MKDLMKKYLNRSPTVNENLEKQASIEKESPEMRNKQSSKSRSFYSRLDTKEG